MYARSSWVKKNSSTFMHLIYRNYYQYFTIHINIEETVICQYSLSVISMLQLYISFNHYFFIWSSWYHLLLWEINNRLRKKASPPSCYSSMSCSILRVSYYIYIYLAVDFKASNTFKLIFAMRMSMRNSSRWIEHMILNIPINNLCLYPPWSTVYNKQMYLLYSIIVKAVFI